MKLLDIFFLGKVKLQGIKSKIRWNLGYRSAINPCVCLTIFFYICFFFFLGILVHLKVERLKEELTREKKRWELSDSVKQEMGSEILGRLRGLNETEHRGWWLLVCCIVLCLICFYFWVFCLYMFPIIAVWLVILELALMFVWWKMKILLWNSFLPLC